MLAALTVRDIVLIESAALEFAPGLNVLTGETGAGKSILLDALGLAAGGRGGGRAVVRPGAAQGAAIAVFEPAATHGAFALLQEQDLPAQGEIVLRRTLAADGRTRAFVNDEPVGVALLKDLGATLLEIHGQTDDRGLFDVETHRALLDSFGGHQTLVDEVAAWFRELKTLRETLASLRKAAASAAAEEDYIRHAVDELTALAPETGEEATLAATRSLLMNAGRVAEEVSAASDLLSGDKGAETQLASALKRLSRLNTDARQAAAGAEAALEQAFANAEEARHELDSLLARLERDPQELEKKEERLFAIRAVARKFAVQPDALPGLLEEFRTKLDALDSGDEKIKTVEDEAARFTDCFLRAARALSAARGQAARALEAAVSKELAPLKLGHARFRVAFTAVSDEDAGANGSERVAFEIATVEGAAFGPLTRIASGGELARLSLALKVALSEAAPPAALVFDEVDRGVGGAVADAVGERLQRLAQRTQVLLVTHSPQVAARAARHFRITRKGDKTRVELLDDEARAEEVARMLSGAIVTEEARAAARRLIAEAQTPPAKKARKRA